MATLTLQFASLPASLSFTDFFVRYQGVSTPAAQGLSGAGIATCVDADCDDVPSAGARADGPGTVGAALVGARTCVVDDSDSTPERA